MYNEIIEKNLIFRWEDYFRGDWREILIKQ